MSGKSYLKYKRIGDVLLSGLLLIVLSPLFLVITIIVKLETGGSAFFAQKRYGKSRRGRIEYFDIFKFRILKIKPKLPSQIHMDTHNLPNWEEYLTYSGRFLRVTGLNELPQLVNVFIGNMSMVGPKPAIWDEFELIKLRKENGVGGIRPGIVGLVQARRLKGLTPAQTALIDLEYYENMSLWLDIKCFFGGIWNIICNVLRIKSRN